MKNIAFAIALLMVATPSAAQLVCPAAANPDANEGWALYRDGSIDAAHDAFDRGHERCPLHLESRVGLGYVALRLEQLIEARGWFLGVAADHPDDVDALFGLGLVAWQRGNDRDARDFFNRVLALDPGRDDAREYLAQIRRPPLRPPLVLPVSLQYWSRVNSSHFEVRSGSGWSPFYIKGINLGAALPGKHPSQFPDSLTYWEWITQISAMGANAIRVYSIHPPHFYQALARYNRTNPSNPLWLVHGVWTGLPPDYDFDDPTWSEAFRTEARRVVNLLHGRADIPRRAGHASGYYTADVSRWTLAYIVGREWEPFAVQAYDSVNARVTDYAGRFLSMTRGTATEAWLAAFCDSMIAYEHDTYRTQRPIAYTSWPTLDPLHHPTETTVTEELAIRTALGDEIDRIPKEYDNDVVSLDPSLVRATDQYKAGYFASYHAYPYYPDFIALDGGYEQYLRRLKSHHAGMPVVIAEYGVPASYGIAHFEPNSWHHGGHTETGKATVDAELTQLIAETGMAGGMLFAWIDEWFKKNWVVIDLELPLERVRMWLSRLNAEQQYGIIATDPEPRLAGQTLRDRLPAWRNVPPLYADHLRALTDEANLWLLIEPESGRTFDTVFVGLDVVDTQAGSFRWPNKRGKRLVTGVEFVVVATSSEVRVLADPNANPYRVRFRPPLSLPEVARSFGSDLPGFFEGSFDQVYNLPMERKQRDDGRFDSLRVVINRRRFGRDSTEYAASGYDRGVLPPGPFPDGAWERDSASGAIEIRIPWGLINVADPSDRQVLIGTGTSTEKFQTVRVSAIRVVLAARDSEGAWRQWPQDSRDEAAAFTWPTWNEPRWRARVRPGFVAMREVFADIDREGYPR
jgi:hypothetical protein